MEMKKISHSYGYLRPKMKLLSVTGEKIEKRNSQTNLKLLKLWCLSRQSCPFPYVFQILGSTKIWNPEKETETETEYGIREWRFQAIDL